MDYDLALKLKLAGFPKRVSIGTFVWRGDLESWQIARDAEDINLETVLVRPTLSELIEACVQIMQSHNIWKNEKGFPKDQWHFNLGANMNTSGNIDLIGKVTEWRAEWQQWDDEDESFPHAQNNYFGATPEIATAELFLALQRVYVQDIKLIKYSSNAQPL